MLVNVFWACLLIVSSHGEGVFKITDETEAPNSLINGHALDRRPHRAVIYNLRSAAVEGMRATISLLRGATRLPTSDKNLRQFQKSGSYDQTVTDFFSVKPTGVKQFYTPNAEGLFGDVGDRTIVVQTKDPHSGKPILKIIRDLPSGGHHIEQITYIE